MNLANIVYVSTAIKDQPIKRACKCMLNDTLANYIAWIYPLKCTLEMESRPSPPPFPPPHCERAAVSCEFLDYRRLMFCMRAKLP